MLEHMRTTVILPDDLIRTAKIKAAKDRRTLTSLLEEGLRYVVADAAKPGSPSTPIPVSKASGGTLPGIDLTRSSELEDRMEGP